MSETNDRKTDGFDEQTVEARELAVHEHRNWVRTTFACNNRCIFCLDGDAPPKGHRPDDEVLREIRDGFKPGARLIVSGGEASIHPSFHKFVAEGKRLGYNWIQTITNGRMFAYPEFARRAVEAGLNEATFSMHGHNSELHDTLIGIPGGFAQALRGMVNLLRDGRVVINVDVVINGLNYKYMEEILDFYMKLGIHEFDLLQIVPFGRAWWEENRTRLFYNMEEAFPYLNRAFKKAYQPGNFIWTNRFPVAYLEGVEELIQDPHKLFDEVRGRAPEYAAFVQGGEPLRCYPERCDFCFLKDFCHTLFAMLERIEQGGYTRLHIDLGAGGPRVKPKALKAAIGAQNIERWRVRARDIQQAALWLDGHAALPGAGELHLDDWTGFLTQLGGGRLAGLPVGVVRVVSDQADTLEALCALDTELEVIVTPQNAEALVAMRERLEARGNVWFRLPTYETLSEARAGLLDPQAFFEAWRDSPIPVLGVTPCIHPNAKTEPPVLRLSSLDINGAIDMNGYTRDYIRHDYLAHANRCANCPARASCPGLHINALRVHRFAQLDPAKIQGP